MLGLFAFVGRIASAEGILLSGKVSISSEPPKLPMSDVGISKPCTDYYGVATIPNSLIRINADGGLENALVYVRSATSPPATEAPSEPIRIISEGCEFSPRVVAGVVGQPIELVNLDKTLNNYHFIPLINREVNMGMNEGDEPRRIRPLALPETMISLRSDVHPWQKGVVHLLANPYFAVTSGNGKFEIKGLTPGYYTLGVWHEYYGFDEKQMFIHSAEPAEIRFIMRGPDDWSLSQLEKLRGWIFDSDLQVRIFALDRIANLGKEGVEAEQDLYKLLSEDNLHPSVKTKAIETLNAIGVNSLAKAIALAKIALDESRSVEERVKAIEAIASMGAEGRGALADLVSALQSGESDIRLAAAKALGKVDAHASLDDLRARLESDADPSVQAEIVRSIARAGAQSASAMTELYGALESGQPEVRFEVMETFGRMGGSGQEAIPLLSAFLGDPSMRSTGPGSEYSLGQAAAVALALMGPEGRAALEAALQSDSPIVRQNAALALGRLPK